MALFARLGVVLFAAVFATLAFAGEVVKTSPKSWSKSGWQALRWGMGPGDVEERIQRVAGVDSGFVEDGGFTAELDQKLFGEPIVGEFLFEADQLRGVSVSASRTARLLAHSARCDLWFEVLHSTLIKKYGPVTAASAEDCADKGLCGWRAGGTKILLMGPKYQDPPDPACSVFISYSDAEHAEQQRGKAFKEQLQREMQKL